MPDSITKIGNSVFRHCTSLTSVTIPDSVTEIGWCAFEDINPDVHFIVTSEEVKQLLLNSGSNIQDKQITVDPNL